MATQSRGRRAHEPRGEFVSDVETLRADLVAEQNALDEVVANISAERWRLGTPSPGWSVADQVGHLAYFDDAARVAIENPIQFQKSIEDLMNGAGATSLDEYTLARYRAMSPEELLAVWRANRAALSIAALALEDATRVAWYGPSMGAASFLAARLMETWAHGTDVAEALGERIEPSERIEHIVRLGYLTRHWSYRVRGEEPPEGSVRVEVQGPSGETWIFGPEHAEDTVRGSAEDFCLVVTQRRHLDDTALVTGELGRHWLLRAQAFAGGPSEGPAKRTP